MSLLHHKQNVDLYSCFVQRSNIHNFSACAGLLISTKPCGCLSLVSITKSSGDAPIQLDYKEMVIKSSLIICIIYVYVKSCSFC